MDTITKGKETIERKQERNMCGRYVIDTETDEMKRILNAADTVWIHESVDGTGLYGVAADAANGGRYEMFPSQNAPLIIAENGAPSVTVARWGYKYKTSSQLIINGRAETVEQKPTFSSGFVGARCVVPSTGFFEWSGKGSDRTIGRGRKYYYNMTENASGILYMAGIWRKAEDGRRFVILTAPANPSVSAVHDRMPLILMPEQVRSWLFDYNFAKQMTSSETILPTLISKSAKGA